MTDFLIWLPMSLAFGGLVWAFAQAPQPRSATARMRARQ